MRTLGCLQAVAIGLGIGGKKVLFPPDCIGIFPHLETISVEFLNYLRFSEGGRNNFKPGLAIPTEMVVY
jgi:hypothetical protein